ncbi:MAG: GAF and ANTAR domain-containing protein [Marmoricola sp.]
MIAIERVMGLFVEVADTLVDDFDLIEFMHMVVDHTATISGAASVGIVLADHNDQLQFMAASTQNARHLEFAQLQSGEGPCLQCYRTREPVVINHMSQAADNIFGEDAPILGQDDIKVIQALADVAAIAVLQERAISAAETLTEQLQAALNSRVVIEQGKGMISRSRGVSVIDAFDLMRGYARAHNLRLTDLAHAIVSGEFDVSSL